MFLIFVREHPPTPASPAGDEVRSLVFDGMRQTLRNRDFRLTMLIFFIGLGVFNGVTTWIEDIVRPRGFSITQAGLTGALMVGAGVFGALILPALSDRYRRRVPFIVLAVAASIFGLIGITFALSYGVLLAGAAIMGFFLLAAGPIGFQYGAEVAYPAPEGTTTGLLLLVGQVSGIIFILGMDQFKQASSGSMTSSLVVLIGLMVVAASAVNSAARMQPGSWASSRSRAAGRPAPSASALPVHVGVPVVQLVHHLLRDRLGLADLAAPARSVAATSSTITAALTAASAFLPTVKTPWFFSSTAG